MRRRRRRAGDLQQCRQATCHSHCHPHPAHAAALHTMKYAVLIALVALAAHVSVSCTGKGGAAKRRHAC